jgi:hypothetical protein
VPGRDNLHFQSTFSASEDMALGFQAVIAGVLLSCVLVAGAGEWEKSVNEMGRLYKA